MTAHLRKELRTLATPAGIVAAITLMAAWGAAGPGILSGLQDLWLGTGFLAFVLGTPFIAAHPFGSEFHHRTLVLSMSQPISRARLWLDKWIGLLIVFAVVSGVELAALAFRWPGGLTPRTAVVFTLLVACSAPLWTLVARSTIGGMVFTMSGIFLFELALTTAWFRVTGAELDSPMFGAAPALDAARVVYGVGTLWLGWFVFARFQAAGAGFAARSIGQSGRGWSWLRANPYGPVANFLRKELMLQRPALLTAAIFGGVWIVAVGAVAAGWIDEKVGEVFLPAALGSYIPLVIVLVGTLPVGEETALGIREWQLTLPVASRMQWALKLGVALVMASLLAFAVPWLMTRATSQFVTTAIGSDLFRSPLFAALLASGVLVAFWSSTMFGDTLKASIAAGVALLALAVCSTFAGRLAEWLPLHQPWWTATMVRFELPPGYFLTGRTMRPLMGLLPLVTGVVVAVAGLRQSAMAFACVRVPTRKAIRHGVVLLAIVFCTTMVAFNTVESAYSAARPLLDELRAALERLPAPEAERPGDPPRPVTLEELDRVHQLSPQVHRWLAHTAITVQQSRLAAPGRFYAVSLAFPHGRSYHGLVQIESAR